MNTTQQIIDKSNRYIAGGVVSLNRKTELPIVFVKAQGRRLQDAEGREYYWLPGDGLLLRPVHYGVAYRYFDESEWYDSGRELQQAPGYKKTYKIVKKPVYGDRTHLVNDFRWHNRGEFIPWNENKTVPPLLTWQDTSDVWWDKTEQNDFERRYTNDG